MAFDDNDIFDAGLNDFNNNGLSGPEFKTLTNEILADLVDYVQTQGPVNDNEMRSVIDDYIYEKMDRGELDADANTDELSKKIFSEWQRKKEDLMLDEEDDF